MLEKENGNGFFHDNPKDINLTTRIVTRFWLTVGHENDAQECWNWPLAKVSGGYGRISYRPGRNASSYYLAHRFSYTLHFGEIPRGYLVCHKCDNPACVNPSHLFLGSNLDNMEDARAKGRMKNPVAHELGIWAKDYRRGEEHPASKLTVEDAKEIINLRSTGTSVLDLAARYKISRTTVYNILKGKKWAEFTKVGGRS